MRLCLVYCLDLLDCWVSYGINLELGENFAYKIGYWWVREYCKFYNLEPIKAVQIPTDEFIVFAKEELLCER